MCKTFGIEGFEGDFQTGRQRMFEAQRVKPRNQFCLIGQDAFFSIAPRPCPSTDLDAGEWRSRRGCAGKAQRGDFSSKLTRIAIVLESGWSISAVPRRSCPVPTLTVPV